MATTGAPSPGAARPLPAWRRILQTTINWLVLAVIVVGIGIFLRSRAHQQVTAVEDADVPAAKLSEQLPDTLELNPETFEAMHVKVVDVKAASRNIPLKLYGSLYLEGSRLVHVQTRFTGQVVEVGETRDNDGEMRALKPGDHVQKGDVLAKLWSKEVGEKKSDLVDALSKLYLHENVLKRLQSLKEGVVPLARLQESERDFAADKIEIERLKRTLRSWQIEENELRSIQSEAQRIIEESLARDRQKPAAQQPVPAPIRPSEQLALDRTWAELNIVAPMTGVILEKNFTVGDIVDTSHDMFKIADLSRLGVMANVYEEDLPKLVALKPQERHWQVELLAEPGVKPRSGEFESIGNVLDPMQHTAIVKGWLDNPEGELRVGQFVTATVDLPNRAGLVIVPISSLIDDGSRTFIFVANADNRMNFTRREVHMIRRGAVMAQLEGNPSPVEPDSDSQPQSIKVGELVVSSGAVELAGQLHVLETQRAKVAVETAGSHELGDRQ
ncbi:MAG TPA: efflux RND transporter periplasmic adaptor subunit [Pirellulaceae bacterium]|jgi:cobalt-zinc-cadmium efflux system membrane fusion protein